MRQGSGIASREARVLRGQGSPVHPIRVVLSVGHWGQCPKYLSFDKIKLSDERNKMFRSVDGARRVARVAQTATARA